MPTMQYVLVAQSGLTLCEAVGYSPLGSSDHGILQARILEWGAISFSRRSSQPRDQTWVSCTAGILYRLSPHYGVVVWKDAWGRCFSLLSYWFIVTHRKPRSHNLQTSIFPMCITHPYFLLCISYKVQSSIIGNRCTLTLFVSFHKGSGVRGSTSRGP